MNKTSRKSCGSKPSKESLISRGLAVRQPPHSNRDVPGQPSTSGYSLYSTDSEDILPMTTKGLDRCAALLTNILEGETSFAQYKYKANNITNQKPAITKSKTTKCKQEKIEHKKPKVKVKKGRKQKVDAVKNRDNCPGIKVDCQRVTAFHQRLVTSTPSKKSPEKQLGQEKQRHLNQLQKKQQHQPDQKIPKSSIASTVSKQSTNDIQKNTYRQAKHLVKQTCEQKHPTRLKNTKSNAVADEEDTLDEEGDMTPTNHVMTNDYAGDLPCRSPVGKGSRPEPLLAGGKQSKHCVNQLRTAKYLLSELNAVLLDNCDVETQRLLSEMDQTLNTMPHHTALTPSISTEIELALQPLRTENCHLRRKLRISNKKMRDVEGQLKDHDNPNLELLSCKALIEVLQIKLKEAQKVTDKLKKQNEETKIENHKDVSCDENQVKIDVLQQECDTLNKQLCQSRFDLQSAQLQRQAKQKELNIKELCLNQKDGEIKRMKEINESLQHTISSLLIELKDHSGKQQSNRITTLTQDTGGAIPSAYTSNWLNTQHSIQEPRTFGQTDRKLRTENVVTDQTKSELIPDEFRKTVNDLPNSESISQSSEFESMFNVRHGEFHKFGVSGSHDLLSHDIEDDCVSPDNSLLHGLHGNMLYRDQLFLDYASHKVQDHVALNGPDHATINGPDHATINGPDHVAINGANHVGHNGPPVLGQDHVRHNAHDHFAFNGPDHVLHQPGHPFYTDKYFTESYQPKILSTSPTTDTYKYTVLNTTSGTRSETTVSSVTSQDEYIFQEGLNKLDHDIESLQRNLIHMGISLKYNAFPKH